MPISFKIFESHGFFHSIWNGPISDSDVLSSYRQLLEDKKYKPGFHEITDMRNAQIEGVTREGFHQLALMVEKHLTGKCEGFKTAVIAPDGLHYGMSRMYEMISDETPERISVFREPSEAIKWIGVEDFSIE